MTTHSPRVKAAAPSPYNLLELYREHRDEIDVLTDEMSLFILAFTDHIGTVTLDKLASEVNLSPSALRTKLTPLLRGRMMLEGKATLSVTATGKRLLSEIGFGTPPPVGPSAPPKPSAPPQPPKFVRKPEAPKPAPTPKPKGSNCACILGVIGCGGLLVVGMIAVLITIAGLGSSTSPEETLPPPIPVCERMTEPEIVASSTYPSARVHVSWTVRGGCPPFQGTITARYTDQNTPYATYPIADSSGDLTDTPPTRCPREGTFTIVFTLTLRDRTGQSVTTTFEIPIRIIC